MFIVPQRILMALGTLADQITYPQTIPQAERTPEIEETLMDLLKLVGITHVTHVICVTHVIYVGGDRVSSRALVGYGAH